VPGGGLGFPAPGETGAADGAQLAWWGQGMAMLIGADPGEVRGAALVDQSGGWACFELSGEGAEAVLARLVPLDLAAMEEGAVARSLLNHMPLALIRMAGSFRLFTFRSMAGTAREELTRAMRGVAAREAVT